MPSLWSYSFLPKAQGVGGKRGEKSNKNVKKRNKGMGNQKGRIDILEFYLSITKKLCSTSLIPLNKRWQNGKVQKKKTMKEKESIK